MIYRPRDVGRPTRRFDYVVLGAGPGGLQFARFLEAARRDYVVLEAESVGSFFQRFPRVRTLISPTVTGPRSRSSESALRSDWNALLTESGHLPFDPYSARLFPSADEYIEYLRAFALTSGIAIRSSAPVTGVFHDGEGYVLFTAEGEPVRSRHLVVATGLGRPHVPEIPGIEHAVGYESVELAGRHYHGQRVLVIGKGNSGFEVAEELTRTGATVHLTSPHRALLRSSSQRPGDLAAEHSRLAELSVLVGRTQIFDCEVDWIVPSNGGYHVRLRSQSSVQEHSYDAVIRCTGFAFDDSIFDASCNCVVPPGHRLPTMTSDWRACEGSGMYFAGSLVQARNVLRSTSGSIAGFRYCARILFDLVEHEHHRVPMPSVVHRAAGEELASHVISRLSRASSLWLQPSYLRDVITLGDSDVSAACRPALPVDYIAEHVAPRLRGHIDVGFEHRLDGCRVPVVRCLVGGRPVDRYELPLELLVDAVDGEPASLRAHAGLTVQRSRRRYLVDPLVEFLESAFRQLGTSAAPAHLQAGL
ncbi:MAG TPA: NAD(P)-binding domain-containing protein [Solirubrobacteraceae bacterium]|jgi:cation diffusion facilitator CzcD-associated flavoprotein CzcO